MLAGGDSGEVCLEDAERIYIPPGIEGYEVTSEGLGPSDKHRRPEVVTLYHWGHESKIPVLNGSSQHR